MPDEEWHEETAAISLGPVGSATKLGAQPGQKITSLRKKGEARDYGIFSARVNLRA
ncbi:MAG: hypothetical protein ABIW85_01345 [Variovorax sp.]